MAPREATADSHSPWLIFPYVLMNYVQLDGGEARPTLPDWEGTANGRVCVPRLSIPSQRSQH